MLVTLFFIEMVTDAPKKLKLVRFRGHSLAMQFKNIASETKELQGRPKRSLFFGSWLVTLFGNEASF